VSALKLNHPLLARPGDLGWSPWEARDESPRRLAKIFPFNEVVPELNPTIPSRVTSHRRSASPFPYNSA